MIQVDDVSRSFGRRVALDRASFAVAAGSFVGLVGPNGAGKTTALRIATGFLDPDRGRVLIDGVDVARDRRRAQARLGYLPESAPLPPEATVASYLRFRAALKGVPRARRTAAIDAAMAATSTADVAARVIGTLSKGYRQRVGLADALVADPPVL